MKDARASAAMKATKHKPQARPVSCVYSRGAIHEPSYHEAKRRKRIQERRRRQNRDSSTDRTQHVTIGILDNVFDGLAIIYAGVPDPQDFCSYFGIAYKESQWESNCFYYQVVPLPETIAKDPKNKGSSEKWVYNHYHKSINRHVSRILRLVKSFQCPKRDKNGPVKKPKFRIDFYSNIKWMLNSILGKSKLRSLKLRKAHKAGKYTNGVSTVNLWEGSTNYSPDKHAIGLGNIINDICYTFNARYHAVKVQGSEDVPLPTPISPHSLVNSQMKRRQTRITPSYKRKALAYFIRFTKSLRSNRNRRLPKAPQAMEFLAQSVQHLTKRETKLRKLGKPSWFDALYEYIVVYLANNNEIIPSKSLFIDQLKPKVKRLSNTTTLTAIKAPCQKAPKIASALRTNQSPPNLPSEADDDAPSQAYDSHALACPPINRNNLNRIIGTINGFKDVFSDKIKSLTPFPDGNGPLPA